MSGVSDSILSSKVTGAFLVYYDEVHSPPKTMANPPLIGAVNRNPRKSGSSEVV